MAARVSPLKLDLARFNFGLQEIHGVSVEPSRAANQAAIIQLNDFAHTPLATHPNPKSQAKLQAQAPGPNPKPSPSQAKTPSQASGPGPIPQTGSKQQSSRVGDLCELALGHVAQALTQPLLAPRQLLLEVAQVLGAVLQGVRCAVAHVVFLQTW